MRRFAFALVVAMAAALSTQVALAEPKVSGLFYQALTYQIGADQPFKFYDPDWGYFFRVNISGDVSDNLSYFGRIQGNQNEQTKVVRANVTYKNVGGSGLALTVGREFIDWRKLNFFYGDGKSGFDYKHIDGFVANYSSGSVGLNAYYQVNDPTVAKKPFSNERVAGRLTYSLAAGGLSLNVAGKADMIVKQNGGFGYGFSGSANVPVLGSVYAEVGENPENTNADGLDYLVAGANIDVLKSATGIGAWAEYSVTKQAYAFQLSREVAKGVTLYFGGDNDNDAKDLKLSLAAEFAISF